MSVIIGIFVWVLGVFLYLCAGAIIWRAGCHVLKVKPEWRYWKYYGGSWEWNDGKALLFWFNELLWPISWALLIVGIILIYTFRVIGVIGHVSYKEERD